LGIDSTRALSTTQTDLLLLGLLIDRPRHGYELYQQIQAEGIDRWYSISPASIYYSLGKLRDQGLVTETRQQGRHSSRKAIYRLNEAGRAVFFEAMEDHLATREEAYLEYDLAVYLLNKLPVQRAMPHLAMRQAFLAEQIRDVQASLAAEGSDDDSPLKLAILDHKLRYLEMERAWLADLVREIEKDEAGDLAGERERRGLMILRGDLHSHRLPDLIRLVVAGRHSGTLTLTAGVEAYVLRFEAGRPICVAWRRHGEEPRSCSVDEVLDGLCDLFHRREGRFAFDQSPGCQEEGLPLEIDARDLILRGCRRVEDWAIIQQLVPSADTIFEPGPAHQGAQSLALTETEARVVGAIDGIKDVAAIARELGLTLFATSRAIYCLAEIGVLCIADQDKIHLRHVFREIADLMCQSTRPWRSTVDDRSYEQEVNDLCRDLPLHLDQGRVEDGTDPLLDLDELQESYRLFLQRQFQVISRRFGRLNAEEAFKKTLRQIVPELQDVAKRYGLDQAD
jgi:DNA-binding PadR family transcriptional regulator